MMIIERWAIDEKKLIDEFVDMFKKNFLDIKDLDDIEWDLQYAEYKELYQT